MWAPAGLLMAMALSAPVAAQMMGDMGHMMGQQGTPMRGERMEAGPHEGPQITMMLHHGQELGLSADQERKLRDLRAAFAKESVRKAAEIRVAEIEIDALLEQDQWDMSQAEAAAKKVAALQADLRIARLKTIAAGRALLTPDQLQKLKNVGHRVGPGGGGGMMQGMGRRGMGQAGPATPQQGDQGSGRHQH
jgi:Spy/CpxP family protein refolding chaperone